MQTTALLSTLVLATSLGTAAFAAGSDSTEPPKTTATTQTCEKGQIFDEETKSCLDAKSEVFDDDDRYEAAREMAYAGLYDEAMIVLVAAENQEDPRILNYKGFTYRKMGDLDLAMDYYNQALTVDPDYILARSYMGQGMITIGDVAGAKAQLQEIKARGGEETWAYAALDAALKGKSSSY